MFMQKVCKDKFNIKFQDYAYPDNIKIEYLPLGFNVSEGLNFVYSSILITNYAQINTKSMRLAVPLF